MVTHKCQSKLWRCAQRGQHPNVVVYAVGSAWLVYRPLSAWAQRVPRSEFTHGEILDAARTGAVLNVVAGPVPSEVPC